MEAEFNTGVCREVEKEMKVKLQKDLTTYLNFSIPLCATLWDQSKLPWFYEHFNHVYCMTSRGGYFWVDYLEAADLFEDVLESTFLNADRAQDITDISGYLKEKIAEGFYVMIFADEYYISGKMNYCKKNVPVQLFIYGYNDIDSTFSSIGFDDKECFTYLKIKYSDLINGYEKCKELYDSSPVWVKKYTICLYKLKEPGKQYVFNLQKFLERLNAYVYSRGSASELRPDIRIMYGEKAEYGMGIYKSLNTHLGNLLNDKATMDYRQIHLISEHKKLLKKKFVYISSIYKLDSRIISCFEEFTELTHSFEKLRMLYIKSVYHDNNCSTLYGNIKNKDKVKSIMDWYNILANKESDILQAVCENLLRVV